MDNIFSRKFQKTTTRISIRLKYRHLFKLQRKVILLGEKIFTSEPVAWYDNKPFSKIIMVFIPKNLHKMRAIELLCRNGLARDAVSLIRSMFEELVDFKYMHEDKKRIQDYVDYDSLLRLRLGKILLRSSSIKINRDKIKARNDELEKDWNKVKGRFTYKTKRGRKKICKRWSCENVRDMAEKFGWAETYDYLFGYLSNYIHSTPLGGDDYVLGRRGNEVVVSVGTRDILIEPILSTACALFLDMLGVVNQEYQMNFDEELGKLEKFLKPKAVNKCK